MSDKKNIRRVVHHRNGRSIGASWAFRAVPAKGLDVIATDMAPDAEPTSFRTLTGASSNPPGRRSSWLGPPRAPRLTITRLHLHARTCPAALLGARRLGAGKTDPNASTFKKKPIGSIRDLVASRLIIASPLIGPDHERDPIRWPPCIPIACVIGSSLQSAHLGPRV